VESIFLLASHPFHAYLRNPKMQPAARAIENAFYNFGTLSVLGAIWMRSKTSGKRVAGRKWALLCITSASLLAFAQTTASPGEATAQPPQPSQVQPSQPQPSQAQPDQPQPDQTQPDDDQSPSDLANAARKAKEDRERQRANHSADSDAVNAMANELAEGTEQAVPAPVGYRWYQFKPGDYWILVPADAELEGREQYGLKLTSSEAMGSRTVVILGDPIPAQGSNANEILDNAASRYFWGCRFNGVITAGKPVNGHPAGSAGSFSQCPLGKKVLGFVQLVVGDGSVMPVVCGYPFEADDLQPKPNRPIKTVVKTYDREANGYRACNTILPSLRFNEHGSQWHPKTAEVTHKKAEVTNALLNTNATPSIEETAGTQENSLAAVARAQKKAPTTEVVTELSHAAPGYSAYHFNYCSKEECFRATLQIPVKAHQDASFNTAYSGLFQFLVPYGDSNAVIQATKGAETKLGFLTREQFINTKIDWWIDYVPAVYFSGARKAEVYSEELTTLSNMPARLATFRSPTSFNTVITQLAAYMAPGVFVQVRCSVPEKVYGDAQSMCEHVVRSLEAQPAGGQTPAADDPDP